MNKTDLIYEVAGKVPNVPRKDVETIIKATFEEIGKELIRGGKVRLDNFGTFQVKNRVARSGRNPRTGEAINLPASKRVVFAQGKALKQAVNS